MFSGLSGRRAGRGDSAHALTLPAARRRPAVLGLISRSLSTAEVLHGSLSARRSEARVANAPACVECAHANMLAVTARQQVVQLRTFLRRHQSSRY